MTYDSRIDTYEHIAVVRMYLMDVVEQLIHRSLVHDNSKLVEPELSVFNEYSPKLRNTVYGSDEYKTYLKEMGVALEHHYAHNSHHPEFHESGMEGMTLIDLVELFCDWVAATKRHADGDIYRSIEQNQERFRYPRMVKRILLNTAKAMKL